MRRRIAHLLPLLAAAALVGAAAWMLIDLARLGPASPPGEVAITLRSPAAHTDAAPADARSSPASTPRPLVRLAHDTETFTETDRAAPADAPEEENASQGERVSQKLVVPEGLTTSQVLKLVENADGLSGPITITPGEGKLLADTYEFARGDSRNSVIARMVRAMDEAVAEQWKARAPDLPLGTPAEAVVLASIIAKEAGNAQERPVVASVLLNRLKRGMKLEADVTVSYGIAHEDKLPETQLKRPLTRTDLQRPTPYNSYVNDGLPPTPICNVGRDTLRAALHPAKSTFLFFSSSGSSGNVFAHTADEHNRNVEQMKALANPKPAPSPSADESEAMAPEGSGDTPGKQ
jgi:UPF0755 protein